MSQREKKSQWSLECRRLRKESSLIQSNIASNVNISDISEHIDDLSEDLLIYEGNLHKRVINLKKHISGFIKGIKNIVASGGNLQSILEDIEKKITNHSLDVKSEQDKLSFEEESLIEELKDYEKNVLNALIDESSSSGRVVKSELELRKEKVETRKKVDQDIIIRTRLGAIDKKLALLGRYGGWDLRDHDTFLKIWTQNDVQLLSVAPSSSSSSSSSSSAEDQGGNSSDSKADELNVEKLDEYISTFSVSNRDQIIRKSIKQIPGVTYDDVDTHITWHVKISILNKEKKRIVDDWKREKRKTYQQTISDEIANNFGDLSSVHSGGDEDEQNISMEAKIADSMRKKEQIALWKKQKELEKIQLEVEKKMEDDLNAKKKEIEKKQYQQAVKIQLAQWNEDNPKSARDRIHNPQAAEIPRAKSVDPAEALLRRNRDLQTGVERREKIVEKQREKQSRQIFQKHVEEKISSNIKAMPSNPQRAISSTRSAATAAISKEQLDSMAAERSGTSAHRAAMPLSARDLSSGGMRRAIPAWIKGTAK